MRRTLSAIVGVASLFGSVAAATGPQSRDPKEATAPAFANGKADLEWLEPLPAAPSETDLQRRLVAVLERAGQDVRASTDPARFVCRLPEQVGPVPHMAAVEDWLDAWPDSASKPGLLPALNRAAGAGNWLARTQLYGVLFAERKDTLARQYRYVQLLEWMQGQKLGLVYAIMGHETEASGYLAEQPDAPPSEFDMAAALHHSYPAQYRVGRALAGSADPGRAAIGRQMVACASAALPAYARLFSRLAAPRSRKNVLAAEPKRR